MFRYSLTGARVRYRKVLELAFADGRQGNADLGPLMGQGGIFAPLASDQTFRIFTVKNGIVWNEAIDIAGEYLYFLVMLTSAGRGQWPHDLLLEDWARAGLKKPTILRWKLFTLEVSLVVGLRGRCTERDLTSIRKAMIDVLSGWSLVH